MLQPPAGCMNSFCTLLRIFHNANIYLIFLKKKKACATYNSEEDLMVPGVRRLWPLVHLVAKVFWDLKSSCTSYVFIK